MARRKANSELSVIELASYTERNFTESKDLRFDYVRHEPQSDDLPEYLLELYEGSSLHGSLCNSIGQMIFGAGLFKENGSEIDGNIEQWYTEKRYGTRGEETLRAICSDLKLYGGSFIEVFRSVGGEIFTFIRSDYSNWRSGLMNDEKEVDEYWFSEDFTNPTGDNTPKSYPAYKRESREPHSILFIQRAKLSGKYYARPDYYHGKYGIEMAKEVGLFHLNNILNGMTPSMLINFYNGDVTDPKKAMQLKRKWKKELSGSGNAGKILANFSNGKENGMEITPIETNDADKKYEFVSEKANQDVLVAHRVTSGIIFGIKDNTGFGNNADEMVIAQSLFERNVIKDFRRIIMSELNAIFNEMGSEDLVLLSEELEGLTDSAEERVEEETELAALRDDKQNEFWLDELENSAEEFGDNWEIIHTEDCDDNEDYELNLSLKQRFINLVIRGDSRKRSAQDKGVFKVRYRYKLARKTNPVTKKRKGKSREFCSEMMKLSGRGKVWRIEDINQMSFRGVNNEFGHKGRNYSLV